MTCATPPAFPATDPMIQKMLASALIAGCAAWLLAAVLHFAFVQQYILLGETYETGEAVHFAAAPDGHTHGGEAHDHGDHDHGEASPFSRNALTVLFTGLIYVAYAMLLVAGFGLARTFGIAIGPQQGLLWGIAGFVAFQLAPALGTPPELPGTPAPDLGDRQLWWWFTVAATATGLALLAYGRKLHFVALAAVLLAAPHVIGAPSLEGFGGVAPPEVAAFFAARVLGVGMAVWALMGWVAGTVWERDGAISRLPA
jgi:cobalt transporter subunit CbtA